MKEVKVVNSIEEIDNFFANQDAKALKLNISSYNGITQQGFDMIEYLKNNLNKLQLYIKDVILVVPYEKMSDDCMVAINSLGLQMQATGEFELKICVKHRYMVEDTGADYSQEIYWSFEDIVRANREIDRLVFLLKKCNLSPLEKYAFIHDYVSTIAEYALSKINACNWTAKDQFFAGVYMKTPEVVCAGYSNLMKEIIDTLNIPELKCKILSVKFEILEKKTIESHARCIVSVKDEKYGIEQGFVDDPTWDNSKKSERKYAHFAMSADAFETSANKRFRYYCPEQFVYSNNKATKECTDDENVSSDTLTRGENILDQKMIEKVYLNVLKEAYPNASFERCYAMLKKLAKDSFEGQERMTYAGNLHSPNLVLTKEEAEQIFAGKKDEKITDEKDIEL